MTYKYSDLNFTVQLYSQMFHFLPEEHRIRGVYSYTKRWQRFYGIHNKYTGKGELRENATTVQS